MEALVVENWVLKFYFHYVYNLKHQVKAKKCIFI